MSYENKLKAKADMRIPLYSTKIDIKRDLQKYKTIPLF